MGKSLTQKMKDAVTGKKDDEATSQVETSSEPEGASETETPESPQSPQDEIKTNDPRPVAPKAKQHAFAGKKKFTTVSSIKLDGKRFEAGSVVMLDAKQASDYGTAVKRYVEDEE